MMKKLLLIFALITMVSCGSTKRVAPKKTYKKPRTSTSNSQPSLADKVVWTAVSYKGTPYRLGGTSKSGMDCSGLIYTSFKKRNVNLARTSRAMYQQGQPIPLQKVKRGDLLFFKTSRKRGKVNHVGLVTSVKNRTIYFIHSTSSRGVLVSSLRERYWNRAFIKAKRVL